RHERIVSNDNVVQWEGRRFQIAPQARRFTFAGAKVQLYQTLDGRVSLYYGEARLAHTAASGGRHFHVAVRVTNSRCHNSPPCSRLARSEERRVGKECRSRWWAERYNEELVWQVVDWSSA